MPMKRTEILSELSRENKARIPIFSKWVQSGKMKRDVAKMRLRRLQAAEALVSAMTDTEYEQIMARLEIKPGQESAQGELF